MKVEDEDQSAAFRMFSNLAPAKKALDAIPSQVERAFKTDVSMPAWDINTFNPSGKSGRGNWRMWFNNGN